MLHERRLYMRTWGFNVNKNSALWKCFSRNTADTRCMRNTANFYIRNVMTGLRKSPEERTHTETEVLHEVFTGIQKANTLAVERYRENLRKLRLAGGMKSAVVCSCLKLKQFSYPTRTNWFLSYEVLDAVFKVTGHPVYCRMDSQVNQNAIRKTVKAWKRKAIPQRQASWIWMRSRSTKKDRKQEHSPAAASDAGFTAVRTEPS